MLSGTRIPYIGRLDRGSIDDKILTEKGGSLAIAVAVLHGWAAILLGWSVG